ncbi:hypothetical protein [Parachlamydia acanthamoebae]|uniref:hypothetical protein n=1 Tax=Parachlamydia acanthamoebae TaxID=83552 RepID=UPI000A65265F|nr:hypothetical protein [Parachlamydia acanthamoebae]
MEDFRFSSEKMPSTNEQNDPLEEILRKGAQKLLQQAIEFEVQEYLELYKQSKESTHQSPAVRNGYLPEKNIRDFATLFEKDTKYRCGYFCFVS